MVSLHLRCKLLFCVALFVATQTKDSSCFCASLGYAPVLGGPSGRMAGESTVGLAVAAPSVWRILEVVVTVDGSRQVA